MFQLQRPHAVVAADEASESRDRPGAVRAFDPVHLRRQIDRRGRDVDADHPPVTGGNSATSRAPAIGASSVTNA